MKKIVVIGSINMDIVSSMEAYPSPGQTIHGTGFGTYPGGKGANQAVAAGKLGANVVFLGKVGDDIYGQRALQALASADVDTSHIEVEPGMNTGIANIWVNGNGENSIVLDAGANGLVDAAYLQRHLDVLDDCAMALLQLEIPMQTVEWAAQCCAEHGVPVMLDPAPAAVCSEKLLSYVDCLTPNETEIQIVSGCQSPEEGAARLLEMGVGRVLHKAGAAGCYLIDRVGKRHAPGFRVKAVDTTAAGDTFNAAYAVARSRGMTEMQAMEYANAAGALAVTGMGAQSAMPDDAGVRTLLKTKGTSFFGEE